MRAVSKHAVAVTRDGQIVGHIPEKNSRVVSYFFHPFREPGDEATCVHECLLVKIATTPPNCHAHWP